MIRRKWWFENDVLIEPRRSSISSRSSVFIERRFSFRHSCKKWDGVPIIAANMDTTGTFEVYDVLAKNNILTAMNKFYKSDDSAKLLTIYSNIAKTATTIIK